MRRNGLSPTGAQRWYCTPCRSAATRPPRPAPPGIPPGEFTCRQCGRVAPGEEFRRGTLNGRRPQCLRCFAAYERGRTGGRRIRRVIVDLPADLAERVQARIDQTRETPQQIGEAALRAYLEAG
jgi:hypothetical protein